MSELGFILPLFLKVDDTPEGLIPRSTPTDKTLPLFVNGRGLFSSSLNLFTEGWAGMYGFLNLYVGGMGETTNAQLPLVLYNNQVTASLDLYIAGEGTLDGGFPASSSLNLFLRRNPSSVLPLVVRGPGTGVNSSLELYVSGISGLTGTLPLSIPNVNYFSSSILPLYVHGF